MKNNNARHAIMIDFGSTFTKVAVADLERRSLVMSDKVPSTVGTDAGVGLDECFRRAGAFLTEEEFGNAVKLASSSAAGGLRMSVIGLTDAYSVLAGRSAALGAGAKIIAHFSGRLNDDKIHSLETSNTEIILFCGGYEHGNTKLVLENAEALANSRINVPVIYAGNSDVSHSVRALFAMNGKQCYIAGNLIPRIGELNAEPVQNIIRNLFLERITDMKGLSRVKRVFQTDMIPTPLAVLRAGELLNKGTDRTEGIGDFMIVDVGGATTDVYSFNENKGRDGARLVGVEEPFAKRTVEGDLGMRETSGWVINEERMEEAASEAGIAKEHLRRSINNRMQNISFLPEEDETEKRIDDTIASMAVRIAVRRHAGRIEPSFSQKNLKIQYGKNLTAIRRLIATGGILVFNPDPVPILKNAQKRERENENVLIPEELEIYLDSDYVMFSAGLLREIDEEAAIAIMKNSIKKCL